MDERIRRMVAYAAGGRNKGQFGSSIYSYDQGGYTNMSQSYDYGEGAHFSGAEGGNMFHYGAGAYVNLQMEGGRFRGYDYSSGSHFAGEVRNNSISIYDYGRGQYFNYSV
ncbi:MAG: hypothetical protein AAF230_05925 [Pseudomonadota bacterium]